MRFLILWLLTAAVCIADTPSASLPIGVGRLPYVQRLAPTEATIVWRTDFESTPVLKYGAAPGQLDNTVPAVDVITRLSPDLTVETDPLRLHSAPNGTRQYEARITGLTGGTRYYYGVFDGAGPLVGADADHYFDLPAATGQDSLRLWIIGDSGRRTPAQRSARDRFCELADAEARHADAFIHLGDMAYGNGLDSEFQRHFFGSYSGILRNTAVWPTMGNHDGSTSSGPTGIGPYYDAFVLPSQGESGGVPSGTESYYSFDIGSAHFVCLNSHDEDRSPTAAMATWLSADLAATQRPWLIAFCHHPPYAKGGHDSDGERQPSQVRRYLMPILESHGVDLVLAGHSHAYERSMLIDRAYGTPTTWHDVIIDDGDGDPAGDGAYHKSANRNPNEGTLAVVVGNGYKAGIRDRMVLMKRSIAAIGSCIIDIDGDTLRGRMLDQVGAIRDVFELTKTGIVPLRPPVEFPRLAEGPHFRVAQRGNLLEMTIVPYPAATDAVVHYTVDGTEPTMNSPVYSGPIPVSEGTVVAAFSVWDGGNRRSPVEYSEPAVFEENLIRIPVVSGLDDAWEDPGDGVVHLDDPRLELREDTVNGVRIQNVPLESGGTILSARLQFGSQSGRGTAPGPLSIRLEAGGDSLPFDQSGPAGRPTLSRLATWEAPEWHWSVRGPNQLSAELWSLVEEAVEQSGWSPGNALCFLIDGTGERDAFSFDFDPKNAAELLIRHDERDVMTLSAANKIQLLAFPGSLPGETKLRIGYRRLASLSERGIMDSIEVSETLADGSWTTVVPASIEVVAASDGIWEDVSLAFDAPEWIAKERLFLRVGYSQELP